MNYFFFILFHEFFLLYFFTNFFMYFYFNFFIFYFSFFFCLDRFILKFGQIKLSQLKQDKMVHARHRVNK